MQRPTLVRRNANLPPNVSKESAFCYQTNSRPYHFNISMGHQQMHRRREMQRSSSCNYVDDDDDNDAAFDVTDSEGEDDNDNENEEEDEYETNVHLALDNDNPYSPGSSCFNNNNNNDHVDTQFDDEIPDHDNNNDSNDNDNDDNDNNSDNNNNDNNNVNHNDNNNNTHQEVVMTAPGRIASNQTLNNVDNSRIDRTSQNFYECPSNSNASNSIVHDRIPGHRVSNEEEQEHDNGDKFDSPNIDNDLDARRRVPSLSYLLPSDDIIISDENENESENSDNETSNNNTLIICQENDS